MQVRPTSPGLWLAIGVGSGLVHMAANGAPPSYLAVNAGALGLALALMRFVHVPRNSGLLVAAAAVLLLLPMLLGPEVGGASRWVGIGPLLLHSGMLALPALMAIAPRLAPPYRIASVALAATAIAFQPDLASAIALLAGASAVLASSRTATDAGQVVLAGAALCATLIQPDILQPVRFVENVLSDAWQTSAVAALVLAAVLIAAIIVPPLANRQLLPSYATMGGFAVASLFGPYPTPLIGYGAAAIIGLGLAVAVTPKPMQ